MIVDVYAHCLQFGHVSESARQADERAGYPLMQALTFETYFEVMARVRRKIDIPVATDERMLTIFSFEPLLARGGADIVQPDLSHCGGLLEVRKIVAIADAHHVAVAPHNPHGEVLHAATVQFAACVPNFLILEHFPLKPWWFEVCANSMEVEDGWWIVPDRSGLGVQFNEDAALENPYE